MERKVNVNINRKKILIDLMNENKTDAMLIHSPANRLWFTKFASTEGYLLVTKNKTILFLDGRYILDGKQSAQNIDEFIEFGSIYNLLTQTIKQENIKTLGIESEFTTCKQLLILQQYLNVDLLPIDTSEVRAIKDEQEIANIEKACDISDIAFENVLKVIKPGMSEKQIEAIIISSFLENGAEKQSFDTIVASGKRGAFPHGRASDKIINNNELVTIDFGCVYNGFCSDTTRTIAVEEVSDQLKDIYNVVLTAQSLGIKAVKPGIKASEIDKICRDYINEKGYGQYFTHSTGHGIGIEIHEFPSVSKKSDTILQSGMVITVEPGIYIPEVGGVRIEDDILVTDSGYYQLTKSELEQLITIKR